MKSQGPEQAGLDHRCSYMNIQCPEQAGMDRRCSYMISQDPQQACLDHRCSYMNSQGPAQPVRVRFSVCASYVVVIVIDTDYFVNNYFSFTLKK